MTTMNLIKEKTINAEDLFIFNSLNVKVPSCRKCVNQSCNNCRLQFDQIINQLVTC